MDKKDELVYSILHAAIFLLICSKLLWKSTILNPIFRKFSGGLGAVAPQTPRKWLGPSGLGSISTLRASRKFGKKMGSCREGGGGGNDWNAQCIPLKKSETIINTILKIIAINIMYVYINFFCQSIRFRIMMTIGAFNSGWWSENSLIIFMHKVGKWFKWKYYMHQYFF